MSVNLLENFWEKGANGASETLQKALRDKTLVAIGEARKQVAADVFGLSEDELDEATKPAPKPKTASTPAVGGTDPSAAERAAKRAKFNERMPWPKDYVKYGSGGKGSGMGSSASALANHRFAEEELPEGPLKMKQKMKSAAKKGK